MQLRLFNNSKDWIYGANAFSWRVGEIWSIDEQKFSIAANVYFWIKIKKSDNTWGRLNDFITDIGKWIENNREAFATNISVIFYFLVWVGLIIGVISQLINSGFWSALLTGFIGGIIVYYAAAIGMFILILTLQILFFIIRYIFYNIYTLLIIVFIGLFLCFFSKINTSSSNKTTTTISSTVLQPNYYCNVTDGYLNVREYPRSNAKVIGKLNRYDEVYVYSIDENNFAKINFKGKVVYVSALYLKPKTIFKAVTGNL